MSEFDDYPHWPEYTAEPLTTREGGYMVRTYRLGKRFGVFLPEHELAGRTLAEAVPVMRFPA